MWKWCSCLGCRGSGSTRYSGELAARIVEIKCSRRAWQPVLANTLQYSFLEKPLTEKPDRPQATGSQRVVPDQSDLACIEASLFCLWQLCPSEGQVWRWCSCLRHRGSGCTRYSGALVARAAGNIVL